jgi:hypothetical protein
METLLFFSATLIVLFLPGTAWLAAVPAGKMDPLERIAEAAGASLALTGLVALYLGLAGIRLSASGVVELYGVILIFGLVVATRRGFRLRNLRIGGRGLLAVGAVLALCAWRLYQARDLVLPVWVDPVHHVLLVRKMIEYGGLPPDWLPYLPAPMYYHYGFHILAAAFSFWSQIAPAQAVLLFGQVINAMVAFSVYRLAKAAWGDPLRAGLAALLTGFGFHMPAYYLSWGRYPLLAGLVVLPLAMAAALEVRQTPADRAAWARLALYTAAVCFCHFLAVGLLGLFFLVLLGAEVIRIADYGLRIKKNSIRDMPPIPAIRLIWQPFAAAAIGALVAAPWLGWVWSYTRQMFSVQVPDPSDTAKVNDVWNYVTYLTGPQRSHILLALAGVGLLLGLIHGRARMIAIWGLLVAFLTTPYGPRFEPFRPDHLAIVLFLPGSLLLAELLVSIGELLDFVRRVLRSPHKIQKFAPASPIPVGEAGLDDSYPPPPGREWGWVDKWLPIWLPLMIGIGISGWGLWETRNIINPVTVLAQPADLDALHWVEQNTPTTARFFINGTPWMGPQYRGVDGGFWLQPLTGRFSVIPPIAYGWGAQADVLRFLDWSKRVGEVTTCDDKFWSLVSDAQLDYIYLRSDVGNLQPPALEGCERIEKIFDQDGVLIYHLTSIH